MDNGVFNPPGFTSKDSGLFVVNIPKNGSTSLRMSFGLSEHTHLADVNLGVVRTVAVVRNPLDRIASSFMEILKRPSRVTMSKEFARMGGGIARFDSFMRSLVSDGVFDQHAIRQSDRLLIPSGELYGFDYVILFDWFEQEVNGLSKKLGLDVSVGWNNASSESVTEVRKWVNEDTELREKVLGFYSEDWRIYNEVLSSRTSHK